MKTLYAAVLIGSISACALSTAVAQTAAPAADPALSIYRETTPKYNDLVHTKLDVRFDYKKRFMYGKEWATLKPHFYPTDSLRLDAQGMDIKNVSIVKAGKNTPLKFTYDSLTINIQLDRTYRNNENYTVYIDYTSKPNLLKAQGSAAITDAKGLYFINPDGTEKDKPTQIWTQGETQSSSAWFPTIDKPNQKTTDEIIMTVPAKYVTLSNGRLASQKVNGDGTRTDTWKQELPHSPYLFMMAVGDFKIVKDTWKGKEVSYYLEPKYAPYARDIFGFTPEVIDFYSKTLGVDYPWNKYSQIVVRDYVSGAMENTSATLHGEYVQATKRELIDAYYSQGRSTIVHELFHQWFGDYVTAESWSNLTVNESFADFSETLWAEHKYGKDAGDAHINDDRENYLSQPNLKTKDLVRFHYKDKEEIFDAVTYQKGGSILYMMRNYLGNAAFYKGLNIYLKTNAFKNGEAHQLRLAMEEASGRDMNWFFNQWYFGAGHPILNITYKWDDATKTQTVYMNQTQDGNAFILPIAIDVYAGGKMDRKKFWIRNKVDSLVFHSSVKPSLVNVDADKMLLVKKTDSKSIDEFTFQYFNAPLYLDRSEAITAAAKQQSNAGARKVVIAALNDKYYELQIKAIRGADMTNDDVRNAAQPILIKLVQTDPNTLVRAAAITVLGKLKASGNTNLFKDVLKSQSYAVQGAALTALSLLNPADALTLAKTYENDSEGALTLAILNVYATSGTDAQYDYVYKAFIAGQPQTQFGIMKKFADFTGRVKSNEQALKGTNAMIDFGMKYKKYGVAPPVVGILAGVKTDRAKLNDTATVAAIDKATVELNKTE
ncbi:MULTISPECIES: M1 family metallopeptidase [unclassified Mucilaginibacter]|uniref:M1 family metallopeptidase n=1 Tax=unclassified Mucilaginibacter TaxID=2617802 RepID=UPI002AC983C1|nr:MULTISPECIES: M1 family metallopeptidase [unclassified Mucilaginibacter]MEB0263220.1 M1 family metallopeptidase [Mucilaginibacter sp. 10I4]MEB0278690.1 M1 family metallopeptidase [Mucilaginibacter sp. 10B2]MEB0299400.1 M1 family metallopeptidase [Mucilaginibacter sp. 5C4]WPX23358.1 M1 family metallopeptidase [Mucilaginibacter sp. 5C4]